ncbi:hypothetical protein [Histidinibacterium aquaticum]|uniref:Lipoprotein n=1 Tax=Histidinibacterium aquaticum TaxID=2613962 RepID=A0A5J5GRD9_9RHOB|nr:hypothetical protein [Histidinibacterium aquaticum]KAA9009932.1 hypothetical protein F3S47_01300 [Histidinibacterium aquaticum]
MRLATLTLCAGLALSGCGQTGSLGSLGSLGSINPFGSLGARTQAPANAPRRPLITAEQRQSVVEARPLVAQVTGVRFEPSATGAVVSAAGVAPSAGAFNAQLTREGYENGTLVLAFRAELPSDARIGQRPITAAVHLDAEDLAAIRAVRVVGQGNALTARY